MRTRISFRGLRGVHTVCGVLVSLAIGRASAGAQDSCEAADLHPWVVEMIAHIEMEDSLFRFARETFAAPLECGGSVAGEFEGVPFGEVAFRFGGGVVLRIETMPPLVRSVSLEHPVGFSDAPGVQEAARTYAGESGFEIDWSEPERSVIEDSVTDQYWDPDPGLNASVTFTWSDGRLVAIRVSSAP